MTCPAATSPATLLRWRRPCGPEPSALAPAWRWHLIRRGSAQAGRLSPWRRSRSRLRIPTQGPPVEHSTIQRAESDNEGHSLIGRQAEGNVEWHPVPDQVEAVDQVGVPAQFPALPTSSSDMAPKTVATPGQRLRSLHRRGVRPSPRSVLRWMAAVPAHRRWPPPSRRSAPCPAMAGSAPATGRRL